MKNIFILFVILIFPLACSTDEQSEKQISELKLISSFSVDVPEPSGLTFGASNSELWTVSDQTNQIYKLDLQGNVLDTLSYAGDDLEGIVYNASDQTFWIAEEAISEIVHLDLAGNELERYPIDIDNQPKHGLEGITIDTLTQTIYVLNEKEPGVLLKLKSDFTIDKTYELDFAGDYSGFYYDSELKKFWIVSDEEQTLYLWDTQKGIEAEYPLTFSKPEGIVIDTNQNRFYIVSDSEEKLYIFELTEI